MPSLPTFTDTIGQQQAADSRSRLPMTQTLFMAC